jgi:hypothetical protein
VAGAEGAAAGLRSSEEWRRRGSGGSQGGGERRRRLGCGLPRNAPARGVAAFCSNCCSSCWSCYSSVCCCKMQMGEALQRLLEIVLPRPSAVLARIRMSCCVAFHLIFSVSVRLFPQGRQGGREFLGRALSTQRESLAPAAISAAFRSVARGPRGDGCWPTPPRMMPCAVPGGVSCFFSRRRTHGSGEWRRTDGAVLARTA